MAQKAIYKITILNWEKHNPNRRKSYKYTMIANNFCSDSKLLAVPMSTRWLFLGLLLLCGDYGEASVEVSASTLIGLVKTGGSVTEGLSQLQQLQLLTYEVSDFTPYIKRNKRIEIKEKKEEKGKLAVQASAPPADFFDFQFETKSDLEKPSRSKKALPKLAEIWNAHRGTFSEVTRCSEARRKKADKIFTDLSPDEWQSVIKKMVDSDFCNGTNEKGWKADFDFLIQPDTYAKVLEGKYDNRAGVSKNRPANFTQRSAEEAGNFDELNLQSDREIAEKRERDGAGIGS